MVKITLEYGSVEEAIQALGKLSGLAKVRRAASTAAAPDAPSPSAPSLAHAPAPEAPAAAATRGRGRPRKNKQDEKDLRDAAVNREDDAARQALQDARNASTVPSEAVSGDQPPAAPASVAGTAAVPSEAAQPLPTEADVQAATEALFAATNKSIGIVTGIMAEFGVRKLRELKPEQRAAYIKAANAAMPKAAA